MKNLIFSYGWLHWNILKNHWIDSLNWFIKINCSKESIHWNELNVPSLQCRRGGSNGFPPDLSPPSSLSVVLMALWPGRERSIADFLGPCATTTESFLWWEPTPVTRIRSSRTHCSGGLPGLPPGRRSGDLPTAFTTPSAAGTTARL